MTNTDVVVVGGGAAGFFAAINIAEFHPGIKVIVLERGKEVLTKVKVSGGGRCNVTHAEFIPSELVANYPRGQKEMLGPFHQFMTGDTIAWFEQRGIALKIEEDGRMFPVSDSSQTIIDCFLDEAKRAGVQVLKNHAVKHFDKSGNNWVVQTNQGDFTAGKLVIATGSNPKVWKFLQNMGHAVVSPVPSLFTFNVKDPRINEIPGVVAKDVEIQVVDSGLRSEGPLLITHWGMSAPAILKLSAFGALELAKRNYKFTIKVNFVRLGLDECLEVLKSLKQREPKKIIGKSKEFDIPKRLWHQLVIASNVPHDLKWADAKKEHLKELAMQLTQAHFEVNGKSTFKEEFVTAGGIELSELNFKTFESKVHKNLYFAGEVLNIDAVTGGFNFQNAWTGAYIVAKNIMT